MTPSTVDIIQDIDEAKLAKDMDDVLNDLNRSKDKAEIMRKLRIGKTNLIFTGKKIPLLDLALDKTANILICPSV